MSQIILALVIIAIIVATLLIFPKPWLARLGKIPGLSPNEITLWRVPLFYVGIYFAFNVQVIPATWCITLALMLDSTDGRLARASDLPILRVFNDNPSLRTFWEELNYSGKTSVGEWLDPLADKLQAIPGLFMMVVLTPYHLGWVLVAVFLFIIVMMAEILGTVIRPPFRFVSQDTQTWLRGSKATGVGKLKTITMFTAFGLFVVRVWGFFPAEWFIPETLFCCSMFLAWFSIISKTRLAFVLDKIGKGELGKRIDLWVDTFTSYFEI